MVWRATDPQGDEVSKCRYDVIPYVGRGGLDLGCGPNKLLPQFLGVDNYKETELFGIQMKPDVVVPSCVDLKLFGTGAIETVFSSHLLEHIDDYRAALKEWWRVLEVGGHLILYLPHKDLYPNIGQPGANPDHKHDFYPFDIQAAMTEVAKDWDLVVNETRAQGREYSFLQVYRKRAEGEGIAQTWQMPKPLKTAALVRPGAFGDAIWASSPAALLKKQGYHVTVYTGPNGAEVLAKDPNIDRIITLHGYWFDDDNWILYYLWESRKYDRFVNFIGVVESRLLPHPQELPYHWSQLVRHARMNKNYLEEMHDHAELPHVFAQRFFPSKEEAAWAREQRYKLFPGPLVVIAPTGSGGPKTWPHVQKFMEIMADRGVYTVMLGELRQDIVPPEKYGAVIGKDLSVRQAMALAQVADVVVGTESAIVNAVAMEPNWKVVLLSHSSNENLTKHWVNTIALEPENLACYPCHRLHNGFEFCVRDKATTWAACQATMSAEIVAETIEPILARLAPAEAA